MKYFSFVTKEEFFVQEEFQPFLEESCRWPGSMTSNAGEFPTGTNKLPESPPSVEQAVENLERKISKTYFPNQMGIFNQMIFQKKKKNHGTPASACRRCRPLVTSCSACAAICDDITMDRLVVRSAT